MIETLEPVWSGTLERNGQAPGLSSYYGNSSLSHSANFERMDTLAHGECKEQGKSVPRGPDKKPRAPKGGHFAASPHRDKALEMLKLGSSYNHIARVLGCSRGVPMKVARENGMDRRAFSGRPRATT